MFKCKKCGKSSQPKTRQNKVTVEKRERTYYNIIIKNNLVKRPRFLQFERKDSKVIEELARQGWKIVKESFSKGFEIVKEISICSECYEQSKK